MMAIWHYIICWPDVFSQRIPYIGVRYFLMNLRFENAGSFICLFLNVHKVDFRFYFPNICNSDSTTVILIIDYFGWEFEPLPTAQTLLYFECVYIDGL